MNIIVKSILTACIVFILPASVLAEGISVIPQPNKIIYHQGVYKVPDTLSFYYSNPEIDKVGEMIAQVFSLSRRDICIQRFCPISNKNDRAIELRLEQPFNPILGMEGYNLDIKQDGIFLNANTNAGLFYGMQTLNQILSSDCKNEIPASTITDFPRFSYRGVHLDVSRHFMPVNFILNLLDNMAFHKLNVFHWHLVDDQGWRLEIKKYPKLTEVGAWREDKNDVHWDNRGLGNPNAVNIYGGYYTQEEVRAVVAYAAKLNITVIPEIEMPAHVMSALAAYPEYSCTGENLGVAPGGIWPITHIYCAGKEETFHFLEDVLIEVMDIFPSRYIHIGGDEATKTEWEKCPLCQKRIKEEGLADVMALQSYFIKRVETFLNSHGRSIIGWDEILEGGLAPNSTVMSWRGEQGGIDAARSGHFVIMTPGSHCYFNHYQGNPQMEPYAGGGKTTLADVYHYEPVPDELTPQQAALVLGAQANLWTEFIATPSHAEYMYFPRLAAMAETLWSPAEKKSWEDFSRRMEFQYRRYDSLGINYAKSVWQVNARTSVNEQNRTMRVELLTDVFDPEIRYTLNGDNPNVNSNLYVGPFEVNKSSTLMAAVIKDGKATDQVLAFDFNIHKAFAREVMLLNPNSPIYDGQGKYGLVDGVKGSVDYGDDLWKGFLTNDFIAVVDLGKSMNINRIELDALQDAGSWIFLPTQVIFEGSKDGIEYKKIKVLDNPISPTIKEKYPKVFSSEETAKDIRFVRITAKNLGVCPKGHTGEGQPSWLFISEIVIE